MNRGDRHRGADSRRRATCLEDILNKTLHRAVANSRWWRPPVKRPHPRCMCDRHENFSAWRENTGYPLVLCYGPTWTQRGVAGRLVDAGRALSRRPSCCPASGRVCWLCKPPLAATGDGMRDVARSSGEPTLLCTDLDCTLVPKSMRPESPLARLLLRGIARRPKGRQTSCRFS